MKFLENGVISQVALQNGDRKFWMSTLSFPWTCPVSPHPEKLIEYFPHIPSCYKHKTHADSGNVTVTSEVSSQENSSYSLFMPLDTVNSEPE